MSKLTLNIDEAVVSQAKKYARENGVSISELVEEYFRALTAAEEEEAKAKDLPILRMVRGKLNRADPQDYRRHLAEKYR